MTSADNLSRFDGYRSVHKALRSAMTEALLFAARLDPTDACDIARAIEQGRGLLAFCRSHLEKENRFIHPAMEARAPGSTAGIAEQHAAHEREIASIGRRLDDLEHAPVDRREAVAADYHRVLGRFVGENFVHMHEEETRNNRVLWRHYSDAELMAIEAQLLASIPPGEKALVLHWMVPALNPRERAALLRGMRAAVPAEAFTGILNLVKSLLSALDWRKLSIEMTRLEQAA